MARADLGLKPLDEEEPTKPRPFILHYPLAYVVKTWLEHRRFGTYPEAGGYNNQDPRLVTHDWGLMDERYSLAYDDLKRGGTDAMNDLIFGKDDDESGDMPAR